MKHWLLSWGYEELTKDIAKTNIILKTRVIIIKLHTVTCDHHGRLDSLAFLGSSYGLSTMRQHLTYHVAPHGGTIRNQNWDHRAVSVHGYGIFYVAWGWPSQDTGPLIILDSGIWISHVFRPGIEPRSTAWKSRTLTTQPATHWFQRRLVFFLFWL